MAEPLKNQYGADAPRAIAAMISAVHPSFNSTAFVSDVLDGYDALALMPRGKKIARASNQDHCHDPAYRYRRLLR